MKGCVGLVRGREHKRCQIYGKCRQLNMEERPGEGNKICSLFAPIDAWKGGYKVWKERRYHHLPL
jgi:hypothetical protein